MSLLVATEGVANDERALRWAEGFGSRLLVVNDDEDEGVGDDGMLISSGQMIFSARVAMFLRSLYWGSDRRTVQGRNQLGGVAPRRNERYRDKERSSDFPVTTRGAKDGMGRETGFPTLDERRSEQVKIYSSTSAPSCCSSPRCGDCRLSIKTVGVNKDGIRLPRVSCRAVQ